MDGQCHWLLAEPADSAVVPMGLVVLREGFGARAEHAVAPGPARAGLVGRGKGDAFVERSGKQRHLAAKYIGRLFMPGC